MDNFREWNEKMFIKYNNERLYKHPNPIIRFTEKKRIKLILEMLQLTDKDKILDVGCGEGYVLNLIDKGKAIGEDISDTAIFKAKSKLNGKSISIVKSDVQNMPFKTESFNKIYCTELLEHVNHPNDVISEIKRVSQKDSIIIITIPNEYLINKVKQFLIKIGLFNILLDDVPKEMHKEWHLHFFTLELLMEIIKGNLIIMEIKAVPFNFFPIRYVVKCRR